MTDRTEPPKTCPPCDGECGQGRDCPSGCPPRRRCWNAEVLVMVILVATFWGVVVLMLRGCL